MFRMLFGCVLILCALAPLTAAPVARSYPCYRLAQEPSIDGKLDDPAWQALPEATGFLTLKREGYATKKPTSFRIGWGKECLYIGVRCKEPFTSRLKALTSDGDMLWDDDSIEFFLAPAGADAFQLIANSLGTRWNGRNGQAASKLWAWQAKADVAGEAWTLELRVPFPVVGRTPKVGDAWRFNLARNVITGPEDERHSCWAPVTRGFGDVAGFAPLDFKGVPTPAEVAAAQQQMGVAFQAFLKQKPASPANAAANGSFEEGMAGWGMREGSRIAVDQGTATDGGRSVRLDGSGNPDLFVSASQSIKLKPGTAYVLRCDIKRSRFASGTISADVIVRDAKDAEWTYHRCGERPDRTDQPGVWGHYELRFKTSEKLLDAMLMLYNIKSGAIAWYDNVEVVEDAGEGEARTQLASTALRFQVDARDATAKLLVNGEAVEAKPGQPLSAAIREGLSVIGVEAQAQGPNPGVKVRLLDHPETDGRWRASVRPDAAWPERDYDDTKWPMAAGDAAGFVWAAEKGVAQVTLRQVILWNQGHDGPDRCINPLIREWGISEGSMETLFHSLYSHFPYPLDDYEFLLDVPKGIRLLDIMHEDGRNLLNLRPSKVTAEEVSRGGRPFTRYRISQPRSHVRRDQIGGLLLPLYLEKWAARERTTAWYYRRAAKGNFTELEQRIPVRVLPPVNGRMPKRIQISQYCAVPWGYTHLSPEHLEQHLRQSFGAGFNTWVMSQYNADTNAYHKRLHDSVLKAGGKIILWSNYPYYGFREPAYVPERPTLQYCYRWLQETPRGRARYFEEGESWEKRGQYCPTYVTAEGRQAFKAELKKVYRMKLSGLPGASIIWSDWEEAPWASAGSIYSAPRDGNGSWCFCERCKAEFRRWAQLPADADLSDQAIFKSYRPKWTAFRSELDARLAEVCREVSNELGKPYMIYSWTAHQQYWSALKGRIDRAFPGCPGNGAADGYQQKHLDDTMTFFRDQVGLDRSKVMGQRFSFFFYYNIKEPKEFWKKWAVLSPTGYVEPKSWKTQVLRVVAALGLGVDLQSSLECSGGMLYWIGEATRILATYEDLFHEGERDDSLAACDRLEYPQVLVLKRGGERLVLLFNEGNRPLAVTLRNKELKPGQTATLFGSSRKVPNPAQMKVTIPDGDVAVVHIR